MGGRLRSLGSCAQLPCAPALGAWRRPRRAGARGVSPNATLIPRRKRIFSLFRSGAREGSRDGLPRECIGRRVRVRMP